MAVLKPRERLVYFRVSEDEFRQFVSVCEQAGARSVSDLARNAVQRLIAEGQRQRDGNELEEKMQVLERLIAAVTEQLQLLSSQSREAAVAALAQWRRTVLLGNQSSGPKQSERRITMRLLSSGPDDPMNGLVHDERPVFPTIARQPYVLPNGNDEPEPPQSFDVLVAGAEILAAAAFVSDSRRRRRDLLPSSSVPRCTRRCC